MFNYVCIMFVQYVKELCNSALASCSNYLSLEKVYAKSFIFPLFVIVPPDLHY